MRPALLALLLATSLPVIRPDSEPLFEEIAAQVGLTFVHDGGATGQFYVPEVMGAGAAPMTSGT